MKICKEYNIHTSHTHGVNEWRMSWMKNAIMARTMKNSTTVNPKATEQLGTNAHKNGEITHSNQRFLNPLELDRNEYPWQQQQQQGHELQPTPYISGNYTKINKKKLGITPKMNILSIRKYAPFAGTHGSIYYDTLKT